MDLAVELLVVGILVPAAIAGVVTWCALRLGTGRSVQRYALPMAAALAYPISYALLPEWAALKPERHWQWLPYLALAAAAVAAVRFSTGQPLWFSALAMTALPVGAAFLLVPNWPDLRPSRQISIALLALYLSGLVLAVEWLALRLSPSSVLGLLVLSGGLLAVALAAMVSFRFGVLAAIAAGAFAGCWLALIFGRKSGSPETRHVAALYAVLSGGAAYVGCIEPERPMWWLLLIPAIPLVIGPILSRIKPYRASASSAQ